MTPDHRSAVLAALLLLLSLAKGDQVSIDCSTHCTSCVDVDPSQCGPGTVFRVDGDPCGCCDACVQLQDVGQPCNSRLLLSLEGGSVDLSLSSAECRPGLECVSGVCSHQRGSCGNSDTMLTYSPTCDQNQYFSPQQCDESRCFCVDIYFGTPLVYRPLPIGESRNSNCLCPPSITYPHLTGPSQLFPIVKSVCDDYGNFEEIQCSTWHCWCVDPRSGGGVMGTKVDIPINHAEIKSCAQLSQYTLSPKSAFERVSEFGTLLAHLDAECDSSPDNNESLLKETGSSPLQSSRETTVINYPGGSKTITKNIEKTPTSTVLSEYVKQTSTDIQTETPKIQSLQKFSSPTGLQNNVPPQTQRSPALNFGPSEPQPTRPSLSAYIQPSSPTEPLSSNQYPNEILSDSSPLKGLSNSQRQTLSGQTKEVPPAPKSTVLSEYSKQTSTVIKTDTTKIQSPQKGSPLTSFQNNVQPQTERSTGLQYVSSQSKPDTKIISASPAFPTYLQPSSASATRPSNQYPNEIISDSLPLRRSSESENQAPYGQPKEVIHYLDPSEKQDNAIEIPQFADSGFTGPQFSQRPTLSNLLETASTQRRQKVQQASNFLSPQTEGMQPTLKNRLLLNENFPSSSSVMSRPLQSVSSLRSLLPEEQSPKSELDLYKDASEPTAASTYSQTIPSERLQTVGSQKEDKNRYFSNREMPEKELSQLPTQSGTFPSRLQDKPYTSEKRKVISRPETIQSNDKIRINSASGSPVQKPSIAAKETYPSPSFAKLREARRKPVSTRRESDNYDLPTPMLNFKSSGRFSDPAGQTAPYEVSQAQQIRDSSNDNNSRQDYSGSPLAVLTDREANLFESFSTEPTFDGKSMTNSDTNRAGTGPQDVKLQKQFPSSTSFTSPKNKVSTKPKDTSQTTRELSPYAGAKPSQYANKPSENTQRPSMPSKFSTDKSQTSRLSKSVLPTSENVKTGIPYRTGNERSPVMSDSSNSRRPLGTPESLTSTILTPKGQPSTLSKLPKQPTTKPQSESSLMSGTLKQAKQTSPVYQPDYTSVTGPQSPTLPQISESSRPITTLKDKPQSFSPSSETNIRNYYPNSKARVDPSVQGTQFQPGLIPSTIPLKLALPKPSYQIGDQYKPSVRTPISSLAAGTRAQPSDEKSSIITKPITSTSIEPVEGSISSGSLPLQPFSPLGKITLTQPSRLQPKQTMTVKTAPSRATQSAQRLQYEPDSKYVKKIQLEETKQSTYLAPAIKQTYPLGGRTGGTSVLITPTASHKERRLPSSTSKSLRTSDKFSNFGEETSPIEVNQIRSALEPDVTATTSDSTGMLSSLSLPESRTQPKSISTPIKQSKPAEQFLTYQIPSMSKPTKVSTRLPYQGDYAPTDTKQVQPSENVNYPIKRPPTYQEPWTSSPSYAPGTRNIQTRPQVLAPSTLQGDTDNIISTSGPLYTSQVSKPTSATFPVPEGLRTPKDVLLPNYSQFDGTVPTMPVSLRSPSNNEYNAYESGIQPFTKYPEFNSPSSALVVSDSVSPSRIQPSPLSSVSKSRYMPEGIISGLSSMPSSVPVVRRSSNLKSTAWPSQQYLSQNTGELHPLNPYGQQSSTQIVKGSEIVTTLKAQTSPSKLASSLYPEQDVFTREDARNKYNPSFSPSSNMKTQTESTKDQQEDTLPMYSDNSRAPQPSYTDLQRNQSPMFVVQEKLSAPLTYVPKASSQYVSPSSRGYSPSKSSFVSLPTSVIDKSSSSVSSEILDIPSRAVQQPTSFISLSESISDPEVPKKSPQAPERLPNIPTNVNEQMRKKSFVSPSNAIQKTIDPKVTSTLQQPYTSLQPVQSDALQPGPLYEVPSPFSPRTQSDPALLQGIQYTTQSHPIDLDAVQNLKYDERSSSIPTAKQQVIETKSMYKQTLIVGGKEPTVVGQPQPIPNQIDTGLDSINKPSKGIQPLILSQQEEYNPQISGNDQFLTRGEPGKLDNTSPSEQSDSLAPKSTLNKYTPASGFNGLSQVNPIDRVDMYTSPSLDNAPKEYSQQKMYDSQLSGNYAQDEALASTFLGPKTQVSFEEPATPIVQRVESYSKQVIISPETNKDTLTPKETFYSQDAGQNYLDMSSNVDGKTPNIEEIIVNEKEVKFLPSEVDVISLNRDIPETISNVYDSQQGYQPRFSKPNSWPSDRQSTSTNRIDTVAVLPTTGKSMASPMRIQTNDVQGQEPVGSNPYNDVYQDVIDQNQPENDFPQDNSPYLGYISSPIVIPNKEQRPAPQNIQVPVNKIYSSPASTSSYSTGTDNMQRKEIISSIPSPEATKPIPYSDLTPDVVSNEELQRSVATEKTGAAGIKGKVFRKKTTKRKRVTSQGILRTGEDFKAFWDKNIDTKV